MVRSLADRTFQLSHILVQAVHVPHEVHRTEGLASREEIGVVVPDQIDVEHRSAVLPLRLERVHLVVEEEGLRLEDADRRRLGLPHVEDIIERRFIPHPMHRSDLS